MPGDLSSEEANEYFFFWHGCALFYGSIRDNTPHSHHALQIVIGSDQAFALRDDRQRHQTRAAVIAPDHIHRLDGAEGRQLLLLLEPEQVHVRRLMTGLLAREKIFFPAHERLASLAVEFDSNDAAPSCETARAMVDQLLALLDAGPPDHPAPMDRRIVKALALMQTLDFRRADAESIARRVHLSASRLSHLFKAQVGIPIRRYFLWLRLIAALREMLTAATFTTAAHAAGFADAAHLSRTFRRMFGLSPSEFLKNSRFVQAFLCEHP